RHDVDPRRDATRVALACRFPFGTSPEGICAHPVPTYLAHLSCPPILPTSHRCYEQSNTASDPVGRRLYAVALSLCIRLQRDGMLTKRATHVSPNLLAWLAAHGARGVQDLAPTDWASAFTELYETAVRPYFTLALHLMMSM